MKNPRKNRPAKAASGAMLTLGAVALLAAYYYTSPTLAFIGLGLAFWGAILLYVRPGEYSRKTVLDASILPSLETLDQTLQELQFQGKASYLPPKYFENPNNTKIYLAKQKEESLPTPEQTQKYENKLFLKNPQGILLTPPGIELTELFEKTLGTSFTKVDLEYLKQNLPKLFIEDLEIAENLEIETVNGNVEPSMTDSSSQFQAESGIIRVRITNSIYNEICKEASRLQQVYNKIGCPLISAIACAVTRATGKPITIEKVQTSEDNKIIEATYRILETTKP